MPTFSDPWQTLPTVDEWGRMSSEFGEPLRKDTVAALRLLTHPTAPFVAMSAFGFGLAAYAVGAWAGTMIGAAQASQRMFAPLDKPREAGGRPAAEVIPLPSRSRPALKVVPKVEEPASAMVPAEEPTARLEAAEPGKPSRAEKHGRAKPAAPTVGYAAQRAAATPDSPEGPGKPRALERPDVPDNLKAISGIGPKLEKVLNDLGIWTYAQIAAWDMQEVAWVDDFLSFKGRIDRDGWIVQAATLAAGAKGRT